MTRPLSIYIIAGEASGDALGGGILAELKPRLPADTHYHGIGGLKMAREGIRSLFPASDLSIMGFAEILPHMMRLRGRIELTREDIRHKRPDLVITIDSPGFNFRVVHGLKSMLPDTKFVHVVAPTVWAYKPERAKKCAALFDHMLVLLPFEPPYFIREGLACDYIGHPTVWYGNPKPDGAAFRDRHGLAADTLLIAVLPGSRANEIDRMMPVFAQTLTRIGERYPHLNIVVPVSPLLADRVAVYFQGCPFRAMILPDEREKLHAIAASNVALVKSGTVTLDVAYAGTPMVVSYKVHPVSAWVVRRYMGTPVVCLANIIEGKSIIPEFLQEDATPAQLSASLFQLLQSPDLQAQQRMHMKAAIDKLQPPDSQSPFKIASTIIASLLPCA